MQEFKPLDFTKLCLDGQVKVITVKEPAPPIKAGKTPYIITSISLLVIAGIIAYYEKIVQKKNEELKRFRENNFFSIEK